MERIRKRLLELKTRLVETLGARDASVSQGASLLDDEELGFKTSCEQLQKKLDEQLQSLEAATLERRKQAEERRRRRANRAKDTFARLKARFESQLEARLAVLQGKQREIHEQADREREQKLVVFKKECADQQARFAAFETSAEKLSERIAGFAKEHLVRLDTVRLQEPEGEIPSEPETVAGEVTQRLDEAEKRLDSARQRLGKGTPVLITFGLILLANAGFWVYILGYGKFSAYAFLIGVCLAICLVLAYAGFVAARERVYAKTMDLSEDVDDILALVRWQREVLERGLERATSALNAERAQRVEGVDIEVERQAEENQGIDAEITERLTACRDNLVARITREKGAELVPVAQEAEAAAARLRAQYEEALAQRRAQHAARKREIEDQAKSEYERLAAQWGQTVAECQAFAKEELALSRGKHPPWTKLSAQTVALPAEFRAEVYIGETRVDLKGLVPESDAEGKFSIPPATTLVLPLVLTFPLNGSLYICAGLDRRGDGMQMLFGAVLRLLCSCPPAKAKLTIIDPVGLGQNFAALMHLADYDESLVNGRIWTDGPHIERKLGELTEHMEKVIQKYLRNRYATIDEYNQEAGQLAEPYRFIIIADFPAGFSELAFERLAGIASSGARCGVYTLILHDARQKLPSSVDAAVLRRNGPVIIQHEAGFSVDDADLNHGEFSSEAPPGAAEVDALLNAIGKQAHEAARVEVPFEAAAPKREEYWSSSSQFGLRLPLGKSGADRLQYLELGKGTSQHVLIAGKTGSGKSNLFHVIITNAALWYSPREVEFYLIDFKKGVEFKTYGVQQLPHARVIAVESDREFGLSVLRSVDKELTRRGELYRRARVQDLPSYRKLSTGESLSRVLLIIDEFQEFFTEEDSIAQDVALLLDRIVRQGRAFGIHVILGSQTLGGTYSLAKSTLGQMAVRIALQCNEADSYLILGDDNAAARLLSRPGEAIYNDMSGLIEGNNPFQAVILPKEVQDLFLGDLRHKAAEDGLLPAQPAFVFEGNSLAELRKNQLLRGLAASDRAPAVAQASGLPSEARDKVWLGEANAIKGPTEIQFARQGGSNLLIIGQRSEVGLTMCCTTILSLAAGNPQDRVRILVMNGTGPESGASERLAALAKALPHKLEIVEYRRVPQTFEELAATLKKRQEGSDPDSRRLFLIVLGLQRFRMLRQDDEFAFSSEDRAAASPAKSLAELLSEGPTEDMHSIVWCDTLGNLNRTVNRKMLHDFEMRVLFQMSAGDSAELIDSPAANRLGLYNALLFTAQDGALEKFRPYATPEKDLIEEFGSALRARESALSAARRGDTGRSIPQ